MSLVPRSTSGYKLESLRAKNHRYENLMLHHDKHHGAFFDQILVYQAQCLGLGIISGDKIIESSQVVRTW
jgi:PIN domain nuclease of toxin-antitoxin system